MRFLMYLNWSCMWAALVTFVSLEPAKGFSVINMDTTINGNQVDSVTIVDGISGPTVVDVVEPAILDGGMDVFGSSIVNFRGGRIDDSIQMYENTTLHVTGGQLRDGIRGLGNSTVTVSAGHLDDYVVVRESSFGRVAGGTVWGVAVAGEGKTTVTGGNIFIHPDEPGLVARESGTIHVVGSSFNYPLGPITELAGTLTGFLSDGQPLLTDFLISGNGSIVLGRPLPGDTNADGRVDMEDLNNVRNGFAGTGPDDGTLPGDAFPFDGRVDIDDLNAVRNHFGTGTAPVLEPVTATITCLGMVCALFCRRRRWFLVE